MKRNPHDLGAALISAKNLRKPKSAAPKLTSAIP
jgi:hypothetical protein